jgi:hypothetical protein
MIKEPAKRQEIEMSLNIYDAPSAYLEPEGSWLHSATKRELSAIEISRRQAIRFFLSGIAGLVLATVTSLPPFRVRKAGAHYAPTEWYTCVGYFSPQTTCVPTTAYYGSDVCIPTSPQKFHRDDNAAATGYYVDYIQLHSSCGGRNAWRWEAQQVKRCSDGNRVVVTSSGSATTFSICRVTL